MFEGSHPTPCFDKDRRPRGYNCYCSSRSAASQAAASALGAHPGMDCAPGVALPAVQGGEKSVAVAAQPSVPCFAAVDWVQRLLGPGSAKQGTGQELGIKGLDSIPPDCAERSAAPALYSSTWAYRMVSA